MKLWRDRRHWVLPAMQFVFSRARRLCGHWCGLRVNLETAYGQCKLCGEEFRLVAVSPRWSHFLNDVIIKGVTHDEMFV